MIDARRFETATGRPPQQDDLDRCNCPYAGMAGHYACGWCTRCDKPRFVCGHIDTSFAIRLPLKGDHE